MEERIYLNKNYKLITCGSVDRVKKVFAEILDGGLRRFYINGDHEARAICEKLGYTEGSNSDAPIGGNHDTAETFKSDTARLVKEGAISPSEYYCKDHEDLHARGEVNYYACIEKFLTDKWEIDEGKDEDASRKADVISLDTEANDASDAEEGETSTEVATVSPIVPEPDERTHTLNASQCRRLIGQIRNGYELGALYAGELKHPGFEPLGRLSIKNAIKTQFKRMNLKAPEFIV